MIGFNSRSDKFKTCSTGQCAKLFANAFPGSHLCARGERKERGYLLAAAKFEIQSRHFPHCRIRSCRLYSAEHRQNFTATFWRRLSSTVCTSSAITSKCKLMQVNDDAISLYSAAGTATADVYINFCTLLFFLLFVLFITSNLFRMCYPGGIYRWMDRAV